MSRHSNQARPNGPRSSTAAAGSNPTYKTHVQRDSRTKSSTAAAGDSKRKKDLSVDGGQRTTETTSKQNNKSTNAVTPSAGYGSGHYEQNKG